MLEQKRRGKITEIHTTMAAVKNAQTQEERDALAKKIADFWANP